MLHLGECYMVMQGAKRKKTGLRAASETGLLIKRCTPIDVHRARRLGYKPSQRATLGAYPMMKMMMMSTGMP